MACFPRTAHLSVRRFSFVPEVRAFLPAGTMIRRHGGA